MSRPTQGQAWPRFQQASSGGAQFPDDVTQFGTTTADDEEWTSDINTWTAEVSPSGSNSYDINDAFAPSRIRLSVASGTNDALSLTKALTIDSSVDMSVTFDVAGIFRSDFRSIEVGFRSGSGSATAAMVAAIGHTTISSVNATYLTRRKYSNVGSGTFTEQSTENLWQASTDPIARKLYLHLQRVSNTWSAWYSHDGISWSRVGSTETSDSFTATHMWFRMGGFGSGGKYVLSNDWIRFNRFFL